ncbi:MAG: hypothetical protein RBT76_03215 [candidate division Zixibacteria bacterium]|jgi:hypothetical protein|nr:hypothetical protein [candidate division Zixibacteria bacterium]
MTINRYRIERPEQISQALSEETIKYRDELYEMNGTILTVHDARVAVHAFDQYARGFEVTTPLTYYQKKLMYRYIRRIRPGRYR